MLEDDSRGEAESQQLVAFLQIVRILDFVRFKFLARKVWRITGDG